MNAQLPEGSFRTDRPGSGFPHWYASLSGYRRRAGELAVALVYHHVGEPPFGCGPARGLYVSERLLQRQLEEIRAAGWSFLFPGEPVRPRSVLLTFDDGYQSVFTRGLPLLQQYGAKAVVFLVAGLLGDWNRWDWALKYPRVRLMGEGEVREWLACGQVIGAHTLQHPHLSVLPLEQAREEIAGSKKRLEDRFGVPVRYFAYPYGERDARIAELVREAGYEGAFTVEPGPYAVGADPFGIPRLMARSRPRNLRSLAEAARDWVWAMVG
jgi:peptidoglycan/xylan/chitin deacetylase (PgdA/CDA1 family)